MSIPGQYQLQDMLTSSNRNISALLAICAGNSPVTGEFPAQRSVARSFDVFFDLRPNKRLSKQWWGWWFETPSCPLWRHCNPGAGARTQEYNSPRFRRCDEWCAFGIAILLYTTKGVPVAHRPTKRSPSRHFRCGLVRKKCWKKSNISIDRRR